MNRLAKFLNDSGLSEADFAQQCGVHQSTIHRVAKGVLQPNLDLAYAIQRATEQKVPMVYWLSK